MIEQISNDSSDNLADDIFGTSEYKALVPKKKEFKPWHKPRKQFVRDIQWCKEIRQLLEGFTPEGSTLKYLGLPGEDLLDLRFFHDEVCKPNSLMLKYLGFNNDGNSKSPKGAGLHISVHEVNKLEFISSESDVIPDNFCQIANAKSVAAERSKEMGPFDVINIDLCDGIGKESHEFLETHYGTLHRLMTLQSRRTNPWLLFITTRTGHEHTNEKVFEKLRSLYEKNLVDCDAFLQASNAEYSINNNITLKQAIGTGKGISDVFLIALCKWIASLGLTQNPKAKIEVQSVYSYKVKPENDFQDLVSLSLKITPTDIGQKDELGLTQLPEDSLCECETAVQALKCIRNQVDVDDVLSKNPDIKKDMVEATLKLLELARYDVSEYPAKVAQWG